MIVTKEHQDETRHHIVHSILPHLEQNGNMGVNGVSAGIPGSLIGPNTVGNYAEVLKRNLTPNAINIVNDNLNQGTQYTRRQMIPVYTDKSEVKIDSSPQTVSTSRYKPLPDTHNEVSTISNTGTMSTPQITLQFQT